MIRFRLSKTCLYLQQLYFPSTWFLFLFLDKTLCSLHICLRLIFFTNSAAFPSGSLNMYVKDLYIEIPFLFLLIFIGILKNALRVHIRAYYLNIMFNALDKSLSPRSWSSRLHFMYCFSFVKIWKNKIHPWILISHVCNGFYPTSFVGF